MLLDLFDGAFDVGVSKSDIYHLASDNDSLIEIGGSFRLHTVNVFHILIRSHRFDWVYGFVP